MDKAVLIARILLGLIFFIFGLNFFFQFIPMPQPPERAAAFMGALLATGYLLPFLKIVEISCGLLLLIGRFVPLALVLLAPGIVNIVLYHLFLDPSGMVQALVILVLELFLAWAYRDAFRGLFSAKPPIAPAGS